MIPIDTIQRFISFQYGLQNADMLSRRRASSVARPRQIAMYLARKLTGNSYPEIGRKFGGKDHTTVLHAFRHITNLRAQDKELNDRLITFELFLSKWRAAQ